MLFFALLYICHVLGPVQLVLHDIMISSLKMVFPLLFLVILGCDWVVRDDIANFLKDQGFQNLPEIFLSEEIEVRQLNWLSYQNLIDLWIGTIGARIRIRRCQGRGSLGVLVAYGIHFSTLLVSHYLWNIFHTICNLLYSSLYQLLCTLSEPLSWKDFPHNLQTILMVMITTLVHF